MGWIGLALGALIGASFAGFRGGVVGAAIGFVAGELLRRLRLPASAPSEASLPRRLAEIEQRLAAIETRLGSERVDDATASVAARIDSEAAPPAPATQVVVHDLPPVVALPVRKGGSGAATLSERAAASASTPATLNAVWTWFTGGNAMVRVGVVVLFFGIAFLLSYFADHFTLPIEIKFAAVALVGAAMIGLGARLRAERRAYAMALIGGGLGVLYLTVFAVLDFAALIAPALAFGLLTAVSALAVALALRFDAQALAALAALGGLLAPALVESEASATLLFGYVAVVNAIVLAVAWRRSWRALSVIGFTFTFLLALWWGYEYYRPEYFATVEPFLVLYFATYVAVPLANRTFAEAGDRRLDAVLVFGVPIVGFALQAALVRGIAYGLAWSAAAIALLYAALWGALKHRSDPKLAPLAASYAALAIVFATLVVPLALDVRWTSAIWAVEAAAVYWNACRQDSAQGRIFALLLQLAAGVALILGASNEYSAPMFINRPFFGVAMIALSGLATTRFADSLGERLPTSERALVPLVFAWSCGWWLAGGALEVHRHVSDRFQAHAMLAWIGGSIAIAFAFARFLSWARLEWSGVALLPALVAAVAYDLWRSHTGMPALGWALYPLAWALQFAMLRRAETRLPAASAEQVRVREQRLPWISAAHVLSMLVLLGQLCWEAGEWTARTTPLGTAWAACAHLLPLAAYLLTIAFASRAERWPFASFANTYVGIVGALAAIALAAGATAMAMLHPGDASPLPYLPLANPLEITLAVALGAIIAWERVRDRSLVMVTLAAGSFVIVNGAVVRSVHHWLDVPWRFAALAASKPLQAALTLTWSAAALALMVTASRRGMRSVWLAGAALLAAAVTKLFAVDLAALSGLTRVIAFLGVGALLLVIGYITPLPPTESEGAAKGSTEDAAAGRVSR